MEHWLQRECGRRTQQRDGRTAAKNKTDLWNGGFGVNADAGQTDGWTDCSIEQGWHLERMNEEARLGGRTDRWMDGWMDR